MYIDRMLDVDDNSEGTIPKEFWSYINNLRRDFVGISSLKYSYDHLVSSNKGKAGILSKQYQAVFTKENLGSIPTTRYVSFTICCNARNYSHGKWNGLPQIHVSR